MRLYNGKSPIIAAYTHREKMQQNSAKTMVLTDAIIAAEWWLCMTLLLSIHLKMKKVLVLFRLNGTSIKTPVNADFANAEFNYQEFIAAYQELLRGRETLAHDTRRIRQCTNVPVDGNFIEF